MKVGASPYSFKLQKGDKERNYAGYKDLRRPADSYTINGIGRPSAGRPEQ